MTHGLLTKSLFVPGGVCFHLHWLQITVLRVLCSIPPAWCLTPSSQLPGALDTFPSSSLPALCSADSWAYSSAYSRLHQPSMVNHPFLFLKTRRLVHVYYFGYWQRNNFVVVVVFFSLQPQKAKCINFCFCFSLCMQTLLPNTNRYFPFLFFPLSLWSTNLRMVYKK